MGQKSGVLAAIAILLVILTAGATLAIVKKTAETRSDSIGVFDVKIDHQRRWVDIVFDRPVSIARTGAIVDPPPGTIDPEIAGVWRWRAENVLRFEPQGGFPIGTTYNIALKKQRFIAAGETFRGDADVKVRIDSLMVEKVVTSEEPAADRKSVIVRGEMYFNYAVDPAMVITHTILVDGNDRQPIEIVDSNFAHEVINFRTRPIAKQDTERVVRLIIGRGVAESWRGTRLESDYVQDIKIGSSTRLSVRAVEPVSSDSDSSLRIELSSPVNAEVAAKFVSITPATKFRLTAQGNEIYLAGSFKPGTQYQLTVAKGLPGVDDSTLGASYEAPVTFPDLQQKLDFQSEGMFLSATGYKTLAIESVNVSEAVVAVDRVYRNNIFYLLSNDYWYPYRGRYYDDEDDGEGDDEGSYAVSPISRTMGDPIARKKIALRHVHNKKCVTTVSLEPYINTHEPGLYRVVLAGGPNRQQTRWILITDLGIVTKRGTDDLLVWVSSFKDLSAADSATVTLLSDQNQILGTGKTDARGIWEFHELDKIAKAKKRPFMLTVQRGKDFSFLVFGKTEVDLSPFDVAGDSVKKDGYSAFVYGERDIYRPGETVEGVAIVRTAALDVPPQMPLIVKHHDADQERENFRINVGDGGVAAFKLDLPVYTRTGRHRLDVIAGKDVIGTYTFQVEEFVPDRIKVDIKPKQSADAIDYTVQSAYLFGPPAAGLAVESRVRLMPIAFAAKGFEQYRFENRERKFDPRDLSSEGGALDATGAKQFHVALPPGLQPPSALDAVVTARVQEQGGRGVAAVTHIPVYPWPYYIGIRRDEKKGVEWVAVGRDGKEVKSNALRAELFEDDWHSVLRRMPNGSYDYESTRDTRLLLSEQIPAGASRGIIKFKTTDFYHTYRVVVTDPETGASSEIDYYSGGWGYSPWAMKNPGRLQLELDKSEYGTDDTATLTVKSPFAGKILITLERDDVFYTATQTLTSNSATIKVPLSSVLRPNAYVTATVVRAAKDLEPGEAGRAFGAIPINVDREANRMHPVIKVPAEMRSNRALPIEVTTEPGATVTIAAVDEGILQLIAQKTADPHAYFYRKLALGVATNDIFAELLPEVKPRGTANAGGAENMEGVAQYVRADSIRRAKPIAFWSGVLTADAAGKAQTSFSIDDFQGGIRIMAVAHHGRHFGSSEAMARVHDPLVLMPTFPRFMNVRDQLSVPVTVRNDTGKTGTFAVHALGGTQKIEIPNTSERTVYFALNAPPQPADINIEISVSGNGETAKAAQHVGVLWDMPLQAVEMAGRFTETSTAFRNDNVQQFVPATVERTLAISPLPAVQFRGKLEYLLHYPYGCVEQTTSSVFPLVYFGDIAQELDPEAFKKGDPAVLIAAGIRRLSMMQLYNGGFSMWPYGATPEPWPSVYATHFLVEAKRAGHEVQPAMLDRALAYIATDAKAKSDYDTWELQRAVYALYVLARAGKPDIGTMDYIREHQFERLTTESKALLAAAYAAAGNPTMIDSLLRGINDVDEVARQSGYNYSSTIRNRALLLMAMLDAAPDDARIPAIFERLSRDLSDQWWCTQESAFALLAFGQLTHRQHAVAPYSGTVYLDDKPIGNFTSAKTALFRHIHGARIVVKTDKPGAFYSLETRGIRTLASFQPESSGIRITRELLTRDGAPATNIKQGDLLVSKIVVETTNGAMRNVVVQNLIPSGLEVENPRLKSSETFTWITGEMSECTNVDIRDDQVLYFIELNGKQTYFTLLRAVTPGTYQLPPVMAEAMYARQNHAVGERETIVVRSR